MTSYQILGSDGSVQFMRTVKDPPSKRERVLAAKARVSADRLRGVTTEQWIVDLAESGSGGTQGQAQG
jgi:hypothetical protein